MKITIQRLKLQNFKGIASYEIVPNGHPMSIFGPNGAGKSTIADALSYLLFNKNQAGDSKFEVKPTHDGAPIMGTEPMVEAVFDLDGKTVMLTKILKEQWVTKRGPIRDKVFDGNYSVCYIDEIETKATDFSAFVAEICREDVFRFVTSITHFLEGIDIKERRKMLVEMAGVTDESIMSDDRFAKVGEIVQGRPFDGVVKLYRDKASRLKETLSALKISIETVEKTKPVESSCIPPQTKLSYADLKSKLRNLQNGRAALLAGDTSEIQQQINAKKNEIEDAALKHRKAVLDADEERSKLNRESNTLRIQMEQMGSTCAMLEKERSQVEEENVQLRSDFGCVTKEDSICSSCPLWQNADDPGRESAPGDKTAVIAMAEKKKSIQAKGKANNARIESINAEIKKNNDAWDALKERKESIEAKIGEIVTPQAPDLTSLNAELASLTLKLTSLGTPDTAKVDAEIAEVEEMISLHDASGAANEQAGKVDAEIAGMRQNQKSLGAELDEADKTVMLLEAFIAEKMKRTEEAVSQMFIPCRFQLFKPQQNGGYRDDCELLIPNSEGKLVPYGKAGSNGERMSAGLRAVEVLSHHFDVFAPVFVDNAESLTLAIPPMESQIIRLCAKKGAAGLTVEVETAEEATA